MNKETILELILVSSLAIILFYLLTLPFSGCAAECKQLAQRCFDNQLQLCDTAGRWRTVADCQKVFVPGGVNEYCCSCDIDGECTCQEK